MKVARKVNQAIIIVLFLLVNLFGCARKDVQSDESASTQVEINPGYNQFGGNFLQICRADGSAYEEDEILMPDDGRLNQIVVFYDGGEGDHDFTMLVLVDYQQWEFDANRASGRNYKFTISDQEPFVIELSVGNIPQDSREVAIIFFVDTENMDLSFFDPEKSSRFTHTSYIISTILPVSEDEYSFVDENLVGEIEDEESSGIFITKSSDESIVMPTSESGEDIWLLAGNYKDEEMDCTIVAFCNWEQVELVPGVLTGHIRLDARERKRYLIKLPVVDEPVPYQVIMREGYDDISASLRTIISKEDD